MFRLRMMFTIRLLSLAVVMAYVILTATAAESSGRYVNPLSISDSRSVADPTVVRFHDKYYMFLSGGMVWVSDDLVNWRHQQAIMPSGQRSPTAPNVFEYNGSVYLSGNNTGFYKAPKSPDSIVFSLQLTNGRRKVKRDSGEKLDIMTGVRANSWSEISSVAKTMRFELVQLNYSLLARSGAILHSLEVVRLD
jgi:hypothetical protein